MGWPTQLTIYLLDPVSRSVSQLLLERFPQAADHINEETTLKGERPLFVRLADRRALDLYIAGLKRERDAGQSRTTGGQRAQFGMFCA